MNRTLLVSLLVVIGVAMVCCLQTFPIPKFLQTFGQQKDLGKDAKGQHQPHVCERDECQKRVANSSRPSCASADR